MERCLPKEWLRNGKFFFACSNTSAGSGLMTTLFGAELNVAFVCKERLMFGWQQITLPMTIAFSSFCCSSTDFKAVPIFLSDYTLKYAKNPPKYAEIAKKKAANIMSQ